jgi:hypothetical protein
MQKLTVEGTVRWRYAVLVALKNWMLKLRGSFESLVIYSVGSSKLDMVTSALKVHRPISICMFC